MLTDAQVLQVMAQSEVIHDAAAVEAAYDRLAAAIAGRLAGRRPLLLAVMSGAVVLAGQLLSRLRFPLDFGYIHATRYGDARAGGALSWVVPPPPAVAGRVVLLLDDILDEGHTLAAARREVLALGAAECLGAVLVEKDNGLAKAAAADFCGLTVPDRFVFGCGMDVAGAWRNLPEIRALTGTPPF